MNLDDRDEWFNALPWGYSAERIGDKSVKWIINPIIEENGKILGSGSWRDETVVPDEMDDIEAIKQSIVRAKVLGLTHLYSAGVVEAVMGKSVIVRGIFKN